MSEPAARGQSTVELALVLPIVALFALMIVQVGMALRAQVLATHAAREAVRVVAVSNDPARAAPAVAEASGFDPTSVTVNVAGSADPGSDVTVSIEHVYSTDVPLIGPLLGDVRLSASATMRAEG